jgi:hypothetical protein
VLTLVGWFAEPVAIVDLSFAGSSVGSLLPVLTSIMSDLPSGSDKTHKISQVTTVCALAMIQNNKKKVK